MKNFNLIDSPWIPVRNLDGENRLVSLDTLFREASSIADLDCPPHERISLMRLLVCITQAELGAPETADDWDDFGLDLETRIHAYLHRKDIHPHFNLFGDGPRFFQKIQNYDDISYPIAQIIYHFASGNNPTLLDHEGGQPRKLVPAFLARSILAYQNFFVGGCMAAKVKGNGPALKFLNCLLIGPNLRSTLLLNSLDKEILDENFEKMGRPLWELSGKEQTLETSSFLARLSPLTCGLWIDEDGLRIRIDQGIQSPEFPVQRDPFSTAYVKKDKRILLRADIEKGIWRDLHLITLLKVVKAQDQQAPLNLQSHAFAFARHECHFWLGEFVKAKDAKIIDAIESSFTVPFGMFTETGRARYQSGINHADRQSNQLYGAVKQYGVTMKNESPPTDLAKQHYWNALEQQHHLLLDIVRQDAPMAEDFGEGKDPWTQAVLQAARAAYIHVCPRQTPRQLQAFAIGLKVLSVKSTTKKTSTRNPATV